MEQQLITDNGVPIFWYPNPNLHSFCLALYIKAGCIYEPERVNGITHFLEHLAFRNLNSLMAGTFYQTLDRCGLTFNAATYKEFVQFSITGTPAHYKTAVDILTMVFAPLQLSGREMELERRRIHAEIREDDYYTTLNHHADKLVWEGTAAAQAITGRHTTLNRISKTMLCLAHRELYTADNLFFCLTGCVGEQEAHILAQAAQLYPLPQSKRRRSNEVPVPAAFHHRKGLTSIKSGSSTRVRFSFDLAHSSANYAAECLLYDILFSGDSCIAYQELSEKTGLIYSFDAHLERYQNVGCLSVSFQVRSGCEEQAVSIITDKLKALKQGIGNALELVTAPYIDNAPMLYDSAEDFNWTQAYECHILNCGYSSLPERVAAFSSVTPACLTALANEIFQPDNLILTVKGDRKKLSADRLHAIVSAL